jgi:hypothetical protein
MKILKHVISEFLTPSREDAESCTITNFSATDLSSEEDYSLADPPPRISDPTLDWGELLTGGYKMRIRRGTKKITLFRFLTAKLLYEEEGLHLDEYIVLFELYYDLTGNMDPSFLKKYGDWFSRTLNFYNVIAQGKCFPLKVKSQTKIDELVKWLQPVLPSKSAYFGLKGQRNMRNSFSILLNNHLPPAKVPPKNYVGVGYRDKGTRKEPHDGNPSWQEVAAHFSELERRSEEITEDPGIPPASPLVE